jgi:DNA-binding CsgD family transcriptional regulator
VTGDERGVVHGLTAREADIAGRAANGTPSRAIAAQLGISVRTVDNHLAAVYRKLDITGRRDLPDALSAGRGALEPPATG